MPKLTPSLIINRCPYCNVDTPNLSNLWSYETVPINSGQRRHWNVYLCSRCGGLIIASSHSQGGEIFEMYPSQLEVSDQLPLRAKEYLNQAINSFSSPSGSVMLSASSVDAMLKDKGYKKGTLYARIENAAKDHIITEEMSKWAHSVRLDANEQRHSDEEVTLPNEEDAKRAVDFVLALSEYLYVLPSKVNNGLKNNENE